MVPAPMTRRALAYAIDVLVFIIPTAVALWFTAGAALRSAVLELLALKRVSPEQLGIDPMLGVVPPRIMLVLVVLLAGTGAWTWYRIKCATIGRSLGKRLTGLELCDITTGTPGVPLARAWKRWAPNQVLALVPVPGIGMLCYAAAFRHPQRRGLHDLASGSIVTRR